MPEITEKSNKILADYGVLGTTENVIHVDFFHKAKKKPAYPMIIKPQFGEEHQD